MVSIEFPLYFFYLDVDSEAKLTCSLRSTLPSPPCNQARPLPELFYVRVSMLEELLPELCISDICNRLLAAHFGLNRLGMDEVISSYKITQVAMWR